ncbi:MULTISPECIES: hypothetical protein [Amycolatopsis]|nr:MULTISPECIES: hypothetical protein [Amycolatopsis]OAP21208.1 hypothetical protein A4R44_07953 [Amycolatopsis sp. M39]
MVEEEPRYVDGGDAVAGPDGNRWTFVTGWLESDEVRSIVKAGAVLAVDECSGWRWDVSLDDEAMKQVVTSETSHKLAKGKHPESVIFAPTLWRRVGGVDALVVLAEEAPNRRKVIEERREPYKFPFDDQ